MINYFDISLIEDLLERLYPICRSLAGDNNRKTLDIIREIIPLKNIEIPSGTKVFDWEVPYEWNINEAYIKNSKGKKLVDFNDCNLHVVSHSQYVDGNYKFSELKKHLFYSSQEPKAIPYRTTYYKKEWGFCLTKNQYDQISNETEPLKVFIGSTFKKGNMSIGEIILPGKYKREILISCYICHPSMANDSLSGVILTTLLCKYLMSIKERKWTYRIVFLPETIGSITYCKYRFLELRNVLSALVVTTVGGPDKVSYKQSWDKNHWINSLVENTLKNYNDDFKIYPFDIHGSDERQYSCPPLNINTISIFRSKYYEYPYYHTSLDNLDFVKPEAIYRSLTEYKNLIENIEQLIFFKRSIKACEPMLSKRDLYPKLGGDKVFKNTKNYSELDLILWVMFLCDGLTPTIDIAKKLAIDSNDLLEIFNKLEKKHLLSRV